MAPAPARTLCSAQAHGGDIPARDRVHEAVPDVALLDVTLAVLEGSPDSFDGSADSTMARRKQRLSPHAERAPSVSSEVR